MIDWPNDIIADIARRKCVIFLGSGVSLNSVNVDGRRPKTWEPFLRDMLPRINPNKHIKTLLKDKDYLTACEVIKRALGRQNFTREVTNEFLTPGYQPAKIHKEIFKLDSRIVATPNFDKIYETFANTEAHGSIVVKCHYDEDIGSVIRDAGRVVIKIHGTIDSPDRMIFTRAEYAEARVKYVSFYQILEALSLTHTFLFIGCGVNDPDIRLLLEDTLFRHKSARTHIMVLPQRQLHKSVIEVIQDTMNLSILSYSANDNHAELLSSLQDLNKHVAESREDLRQNSNW
ncbi:MAG: SIR2 family protein [Rhizobiaceae bacterium]